jgi:hypothetical protein
MVIPTTDRFSHFLFDGNLPCDVLQVLHGALLHSSVVNYSFKEPCTFDFLQGS